jgi:hypothetical protein
MYRPAPTPLFVHKKHRNGLARGVLWGGAWGVGPGESMKESGAPKGPGRRYLSREDGPVSRGGVLRTKEGRPRFMGTDLAAAFEDAVKAQ